MEKKKIQKMLIGLVVFGLLGITYIPKTTAQIMQPLYYYVAVNGNDTWSGKQEKANPAGDDGPFFTIERARDAVRQLRNHEDVKSPVIIRLREGTYHLDRTFILKPEDSGSETSPTIYESYPGERAVISGGKMITGWKKGKGALWQVKLPGIQTGEWNFRQLYVNGNRRNCPRFPQDGLFKVAKLPELDGNSWMAQNVTEKSELAKRAFKFEKGNIQSKWYNLSNIEVVISQFWMESRLKIQSVNEQENLVLFTGDAWRPLSWSFGYHVENVFEEIDHQPGTWYLDKKKNILYYHPLPGEDLSKAEIIAPKSGLNQLIKIEGNIAESAFVYNINFKNITFAYTPWELSPEGYSYPQAEITLPAATIADGAYHCSFKNCTFEHTGAWCLEIRKGCKNNKIIGNKFFDIGAGAIKIGEPEVCKTDLEETSGTIISDNYLQNMGKATLGAAGIWIGQSGNNMVSHNDISGSLMWAVSVGWTWSYFPLQRARNNTVEFNYIHDLGISTLGTHAALYALGTSPETKFKNNYIRNVYSNKHWGAGQGIILDNGCAGIVVENNVVYNAIAGGYASNFNCFGNIILNNVFMYGRKYQLTVYGDPPQGEPQPKGEIFARNIIVWQEGPLIKEDDWPDFLTLWDYNIYHHSANEPVTFLSKKKYSFDEWKNKGLDRNSVIADPMLVDPENGNFNLKPGSPALKLGFKPIDITNVGPRSENLE